MAEAAFLAKATSLGFRVSKPWGESSRYTFHAHGNTTRVYKASEIDLLVAYIVPVDAWYVFPVEEIRRSTSDEVVSGQPEEGVEVSEVS